MPPVSTPQQIEVVNNRFLQELVDHPSRRVSWRHGDRIQFSAHLARHEICAATHGDPRLLHELARDHLHLDPDSMTPRQWGVLSKKLAAALKYKLESLIREGTVSRDYEDGEVVVRYPDWVKAWAGPGWNGDEHKPQELEETVAVNNGDGPAVPPPSPEEPGSDGEIPDSQAEMPPSDGDDFSRQRTPPATPPCPVPRQSAAEQTQDCGAAARLAQGTSAQSVNAFTPPLTPPVTGARLYNSNGSPSFRPGRNIITQGLSASRHARPARALQHSSGAAPRRGSPRHQPEAQAHKSNQTPATPRSRAGPLANPLVRAGASACQQQGLEAPELGSKAPRGTIGARNAARALDLLPPTPTHAPRRRQASICATQRRRQRGHLRGGLNQRRCSKENNDRDPEYEDEGAGKVSGSGDFGDEDGDEEQNGQLDQGEDEPVAHGRRFMRDQVFANRYQVPAQHLDAPGVKPFVTALETLSGHLAELCVHEWPLELAVMAGGVRSGLDHSAGLRLGHDGQGAGYDTSEAVRLLLALRRRKEDVRRGIYDVLDEMDRRGYQRGLLAGAVPPFGPWVYLRG